MTATKANHKTELQCVCCRNFGDTIHIRYYGDMCVNCLQRYLDIVFYKDTDLITVLDVTFCKQLETIRSDYIREHMTTKAGDFAPDCINKNKRDEEQS